MQSVLHFLRELLRFWRNVEFRKDGKTLLFLVLSGGATGASWLCYYRELLTAGTIAMAFI